MAVSLAPPPLLLLLFVAAVVAATPATLVPTWRVVCRNDVK
jgi:hypothetical protein